MRHHVFGRKLNRNSKERKALFKSLILSLIQFGKIKTTVAKAKAVHGLIDKLVTKAKDGSENARHQLYAFLAKKDAVETLINKIAPIFKDTIGGYVRIRRTGMRRGDSSEEVILEWSKALAEKAQPKKTVSKTPPSKKSEGKAKRPERKKKA
ncbi:50S ribosomal protein L17 [Candidatus Gottesmanbacteria bacterium]|nr:50S ribosomal protein L17 [Candidatus Gottesmanbacteria bacterium]